MFPPLFKGQRIRLAAPVAADTETLAAWSNNDEYMRFVDDDPIAPLTAGSFDWLIKPDDRSARFTLRTLTEDQLIGFVILHTIRWAQQVATITIGIGEPAYWSKGYGKEAMTLALNYGFNELNLFRIELFVTDYNARAIALYEKLGFVREGVRRQAGVRYGKRFDLVEYGLLRHEWVRE